MVALQLAALALLAPWRRSDLTMPGWTIALLYPMYTVTAWLLYVDVTRTGGEPVPSMWFAAIGVVVTGAGIVLRATSDLDRLRHLRRDRRDSPCLALRTLAVRRARERARMMSTSYSSAGMSSEHVHARATSSVCVTDRDPIVVDF